MLKILKRVTIFEWEAVEMMVDSRMLVQEAPIIYNGMDLVRWTAMLGRVLIHDRERVVIPNSHPARTATSAMQLAKRIGLSNIPQIKAAAFLHDIGKAHEDMSPLLALMQGKELTSDQRYLVTEGHTRFGPRMLELLIEHARPVGQESPSIDWGNFPLDRALVEEVLLYHHPEIDLLRADRRPEVKIISITDKYDAMTAGEEDERSHRIKPHTPEGAAARIWRWAKEGILDLAFTQVFIEECLAMKLPEFS